MSIGSTSDCIQYQGMLFLGVPILSLGSSTDSNSHVCPSNTSHVLDLFPLYDVPNSGLSLSNLLVNVLLVYI